MVIDTSDIFMKVDMQIVKKGFWTGTNQFKKKIIEAELINYTLSKFLLLPNQTQFITSNHDYDLYSLLQIIDNNLYSIDEKRNFFDNYIHYILKLAGCIQNFPIIWWEEDNEDLKYNPLIKFDGDGMWDSLTTHCDTPLIQTTLFVFDSFKNIFCIDQKHEKIKLLKKQ